MVGDLVTKIGKSFVSDNTIYLNVGAIGLTLTNIEKMLTIIVLLFTAIYTGIKIYRQICNHKNKKGGK